MVKNQFAIEIDGKGSDISSVRHLFVDGTGAGFREILKATFSFAREVESRIKLADPKHGLEIWDTAAQHRLTELLDAANVFAAGSDLRLEKTSGGRYVWSKGIWVFEADRGRDRRPLFLPDGLIQSQNAIYAFELDHGIDVGKWATQLLKAVRANASSYIDGTVYAFWLNGESPFGNSTLTKEFVRLLSVEGKPLGVVTICRDDLDGTTPPSAHEVASFLRRVYARSQSRDKALRLADKIEPQR